MNSLDSLFPQSIKDLIVEYNTNSKFNAFLYENEACNKLFQTLTINEQDRWQFVYKNNTIARNLIEYIHSNFHGITCNVKDKQGNLISGVIKHEKTRQYTDSKKQQQITDNTVSFRREYEDATYSAPETIALWVVTNDQYSTHLYTVNNIII